MHWSRTWVFAFAIPLLGFFLVVSPASAVVSHNARTLEQLRANAEAAAAKPPQRKLRIMIVPGHEPDFGGAGYGRLKERDMVVELGKDLKRFLDADGRFEARLSRDEKAWNPELAAYFSAHWDVISAWRSEVRDDFDALVASGKAKKPVIHIDHNKAPNDPAVRLYGITKWSNEHDVDLMIHLHFDGAFGGRTGFTVYVPSPEYFNGPPTRAVAEKVKVRLAAFDPVADLRTVARLDGIVEDPQLIATGKSNSADPASMLIEYAFINERQLRAPAIRTLAIEDMAYRTYLGLGDFFFGGKGVPARPFATSVLPRVWTSSVRDPADVFALQTALTVDGVYPPPGKSKNQCPRTGIIGSCTRAALRAFQMKYGIAGESGMAGRKTIEKLNALYGSKR
jgi:N-acetylmuramoyl-L-alanine amidase